MGPTAPQKAAGKTGKEQGAKRPIIFISPVLQAPLGACHWPNPLEARQRGGGAWGGRGAERRRPGGQPGGQKREEKYRSRTMKGSRWQRTRARYCSGKNQTSI